MAQKAAELQWEGRVGFERYCCYSDLLGDNSGAAAEDSIQGLVAQVSLDTGGTSSSGGSMCEKKAELGTKRGFKDSDDADCAQTEKAQEESSENCKHPSTGSCSSKRSRAAEVHNLSEKRRRNRINEKMKALQNLIPNSNKTDKASMLDEAIDYLKKLQLQVQILSARSGIDLSSMCMLSEMPQLQISQIPKTFSNTGPVGVSLSMDRRRGLVDMTHGPARNPLLSLHDPHPGSLINMAVPNVSSAVYDDQNRMQTSRKMDRLTSSVLPSVPATSQEIHSTSFLQQHQF